MRTDHIHRLNKVIAETISEIRLAQAVVMSEHAHMDEVATALTGWMSDPGAGLPAPATVPARAAAGAAAGAAGSIWDGQTFRVVPAKSASELEQDIEASVTEIRRAAD
jgi:hypothetical protein